MFPASGKGGLSLVSREQRQGRLLWDSLGEGRPRAPLLLLPLRSAPQPVAGCVSSHLKINWQLDIVIPSCFRWGNEIIHGSAYS